MSNYFGAAQLWPGIGSSLKPNHQTQVKLFHIPDTHGIHQGSQTQSDSGAALDSKKGLASCIKKPLF